MDRKEEILSQTVELRTLREATGNWNAAVMLNAGIILVSFVLLFFVREPRGEREELTPPQARLGGEPG